MSPRLRLRLTVFLMPFLLLLLQAVTPSCANIVPPLGGPRDSLPPVLVSANPPDSTLNFRGNRITLTFDEYVDLQDVATNLLFTPLFDPAKTPQVSVRLRTVTIRLRDSLEPNTTYNFNFGNALRDINENNVLRDFAYTFSTGPALDTGTLSGQVVLAETGRIDTTLTVLLHRNLADSAVVRLTPRYAARLDSEGRFRFRNLSPGNYALYALGEAGTLRRYINRNELFAFADTTVAPGQRGLTLYAYRETEGTRGRPGAIATGPARPPAGTDRRLRFTTPAESGQQNLNEDLVLTFATPLRRFDSAGARLTRDSLFAPVAYSVSLDTSGTLLRFRTDWAEATTYNLVLAQDFATDTLDRSLLKGDTLSFVTRSRSDYGNLLVRFRNAQNYNNPVLQLIQNDQVVASGPIVNGQFSRALFPPGDYELRILEDRNGNGTWDPGAFYPGRRQPERVRPIERRLTVRANWDNEVEIAL